MGDARSRWPGLVGVAVPGVAGGVGSDLRQPKGSALFPYASPVLFSMTIGFVGIWLLSILDRSFD